MKRIPVIVALILSLFIPVTALAAPPATPRDWTVKAPEGELLPSAVSAKAAILIDAHTGEVLFEKNADEQRAPASLTKNMTCLLALERCDLTEQVTVCDLSDLPSDLSKVGLKKGEVLTMEDLLYALMLRSGGDAAMAIAVYIAGSADAFTDMMNERAKELGMDNTHFANPHGLTEGSHYSTARDMATLAMACMKYPKFRKIVSTYQYTCYPTNMTAESRIWKNTNKLINPSDSETYAYEYAIGVKTGYTAAAGYCLASAASRGNVELIGVVLGGDDLKRFVDSITMFEYGFDFYDTLDVESLLADQTIVIPIANAAEEDAGKGELELLMVPEGPSYITDKKNAITELREHPDRFVKSVEFVPNLAAPIKEGDEVGTVTFTLDGKAVLTCALIASRDVAAAPEPTAEPEVTPAATAAVTPKATALPEPYRLGWAKYALIGLLAAVGIPTAAIVVTRVKRERQHKHYRYKNRKR
jgi:D-alanyl-D-alanine carboxypeptidase